MLIPVETMNQILVLFPYISVCPLIGLWLVRRLPTAFRRLATIVLAAQALVVCMSIFYAPASKYEQWFWSLGEEWNLATELASTLLALVGAVALLACWLARSQQRWQRIYVAGYGALFLLMALMEFFDWKESQLGPWILPYLVLGGFLATVTIMFVETSPKAARMWLLYLLMGLSLIVLGGIVVDMQGLGGLCDRDFGLFRFEGCIDKGVLEEAIETLGSWVALVAMLGHLSEFVARPTPRLRLSLYGFPLVWMLLLVLGSGISPVHVATGSQEAAVEFESGARLHAYRIGGGERNRSVHLYLSVPPADFSRTGFSIHLIDALSGTSIAGRDQRVTDLRDFLMAPGYVPVYRQWTELAIPPDAPTNRAFSLALSLWHDDSGAFAAQKIRASDRPLLADSQVILSEFVLPAAPVDAPGERFAQFANGFWLAPVDLPQVARAGESVSLAFSWRAEAADGEDYAQFLHIGDEASGEWLVFDQLPLGARLPSRLWYAGLADTEIWRIPLPADLAPGRYAAFTGLYRVGDKERLPVSGPDGAPFVDARAPLGELVIESADL